MPTRCSWDKAPNGPTHFEEKTRKRCELEPDVEAAFRRGGWREATKLLYRDYLEEKGLDPTELRGKNLICSCKLEEPCHADVLLELANRDGEAD